MRRDVNVIEYEALLLQIGVIQRPQRCSKRMFVALSSLIITYPKVYSFGFFFFVNE